MYLWAINLSYEILEIANKTLLNRKAPCMETLLSTSNYKEQKEKIKRKNENQCKGKGKFVSTFSL